MGNNKKSSLPKRSTGLGWLFWAFIWGAIGYLIYGTPMGAIALALFSALTSLTVLFGFIPVVGIWLTYITTNYMKTWLLQHVAMSWAISIIFGIALVGSGLFTILALLLILVKVSD